MSAIEIVLLDASDDFMQSAVESIAARDDDEARRDDCADADNDADLSVIANLDAVNGILSVASAVSAATEDSLFVDIAQKDGRLRADINIAGVYAMLERLEPEQHKDSWSAVRNIALSTRRAIAAELEDPAPNVFAIIAAVAGVAAVATMLDNGDADDDEDEDDRD